MKDIDVFEYERHIVIRFNLTNSHVMLNKLEASKIMHEIKKILKIDEMLEGEQEELTPCDFFKSACKQIVEVDPVEEVFEFEFYQEILNAYKNYRVKQEISPFSSDEMPPK